MIVYLAWGSLYWSPESLPIKYWRPTNLQFPLEFSRISDKGKGRLTLVIDEDNGTNNKIWYSETDFKNADQAINALKKRENTIAKNIAYINLKSKKERGQSLEESPPAHEQTSQPATECWPSSPDPSFFTLLSSLFTLHSSHFSFDYPTLRISSAQT